MIVTTGKRPLEDGLLVDYRMSEGSGLVLHDISGERNHGTLNGPPTWALGKYGQGLDFNGATDYVEALNTTGLLNGLKTATMMIWVNTAAQIAAYRHIAGFRDSGDSDLYILHLQNSDNLELRVRTASGAITSNADFSSYYGDYTQATLVRDGTSMIAYLNETEVVNRSDVYDEAWGNSNNLFLGRLPSGATYYYDGGLDEFRLWNRALSTEEVLLALTQRGHI